MKSIFQGKILPALFILISLFLFSSCNEEEHTGPDYFKGMVNIASENVYGSGLRVELWGKEEPFAGFNAFTFAVYDSATNKLTTDAMVKIHPVMDMHTMSHSCPVIQPEKANSHPLFYGSAIFSMPTSEMGTWSIELELTHSSKDKSGSVSIPISVKAKDPSAVMSFKTADNVRYFVAYNFPQVARIGMNTIEYYVFKAAGHGFLPVESLDFTMTPEMPSMQHGSPNNEHPVYTENGCYKGKVNFTMTGEWRLNFTLSEGSILIAEKYFDIHIK